jgi:steroid delta-isomerase-like uncharacterized protein
MSEANKALIRRWFDEVWNRGRASAIDEMLAPTAVIHGLAGADVRGPEGFKPFHAAYRNAFPDIAIHVDQVVAEGNMVAARWTSTATHTGDGLGMPATGLPSTISGMTFGRIENGKLAEGWNVFDQFGMLQQLGVLPAPGAKP